MLTGYCPTLPGGGIALTTGCLSGSELVAWIELYEAQLEALKRQAATIKPSTEPFFPTEQP